MRPALRVAVMHERQSLSDRESADMHELSQYRAWQRLLAQQTTEMRRMKRPWTGRDSAPRAAIHWQMPRLIFSVATPQPLEFWICAHVRFGCFPADDKKHDEGSRHDDALPTAHGWRPLRKAATKSGCQGWANDIHLVVGGVYEGIDQWPPLKGTAGQTE